jgi:hypothetical protein
MDVATAIEILRRTHAGSRRKYAESAKLEELRSLCYPAAAAVSGRLA